MSEGSAGKESSRRSITDSDKEYDQTKMQELLLPVHGYVKLYPEEIAIIDHPAFQRLRRMRQLGFAHMVFPGGTHTRFEHAIGAVFVAQSIIGGINDNFLRSETATKVAADWVIAFIDYPTERFIRLSALLHDIGHLPFGHTLEGELNHLPHHDATERLYKVAGLRFKGYDLDKEIFSTHEKPHDGWSLEELVNSLYSRFVKKLSLPDRPFDVLAYIICKPPKNESQLQEWDQRENLISEKLRLKVCQDIVGNTICADFLDYLFRDWHHLGKPVTEDKRLYQYMEIRVLKEIGKKEEARFVINVGSSSKIRHDALTDILDLLGSRYKLAETVLFHRTKLAIIGLLDRCLLEIREIYRLVEIQDQEFLLAAEDLLIDGSDDALPAILYELADGGTKAGKEKIRAVLEKQRQAVVAAFVENDKKRESEPDLLSNSQGEGEEDRSVGSIGMQLDFVHHLIGRLKNRCVYTQAYKLRISDFPGVHSPDNRYLKNLIKIYSIPQNRLDYLQGVEALCSLPEGSLVMYCPPDAKMNAKIAKVNLYIEGEVVPFDEYEENQGDASLTHGALDAQIKRFYELWSVQIYIERTCWDRLTQFAKDNLKKVLKEFFFQTTADSDLRIARGNIEPSVKTVLNETLAVARSGTRDPRTEKFREFKFPSGLEFRAS